MCSYTTCFLHSPRKARLQSRVRNACRKLLLKLKFWNHEVETMVRFKKRLVLNTNSREVYKWIILCFRWNRLLTLHSYCRYLLVEISFEDGQVDDRILSRLIYRTVKNAILSAHGDYGMACLDRSLQGAYFVNEEKGACHNFFSTCQPDRWFWLCNVNLLQ